MNIVIWIGNQPNQKALANAIQAKFPVCAIVTESRKVKQKITSRILFEKIVEKIFLPSVGKSWWGLLSHYDKTYPNYPDVDRLDVENINSDEVFNFTIKYKPDLILVSGTRLVKEKMFVINPSVGILNLHTGISPYVKGGPNCTNWCIANKNFHMIGNTIMWIDKGIDTGNLLTTEFTNFDGSETLLDLHIKVMEHAHELYVKAVKYLGEGKRQSIPQSDVCKGTTFYTKQWTLKQKIMLVRNVEAFQKYFKKGEATRDRKELTIFKLI